MVVSLDGGDAPLDGNIEVAGIVCGIGVYLNKFILFYYMHCCVPVGRGWPYCCDGRCRIYVRQLRAVHGRPAVSYL